MQIMVYPAKKSALVLKHPIEGQLKATGSMWTNDGFTARMLTDRAITTDPELAWKAAVPPPASAAPAPEHPASDHLS